jgi:hypothetical protein
MVTDPAEYPWSNDRHHALGALNGILSPRDLYTASGNSAAARQQAYRDLFVTGLGDEPINELRMALNQNQPIGNQVLDRAPEARLASYPYRFSARLRGLFSSPAPPDFHGNLRPLN